MAYLDGSKRPDAALLGGASGGAAITAATFADDSYLTQSLLDAVTAPILAAQSHGSGDVAQLLERLHRLESQLQRLEGEVTSRAAGLRKEGGSGATSQSARVAAVEAELASLHLASLHSSLATLMQRSSSAAQLATRVGSRLQAADLQRRRALDAAAALEHLRTFACADDLSALPPLFHEQHSMGEAAAIACRLSEVVQRVMAAQEPGQATLPAGSDSASQAPSLAGLPPRGSLAAAAEQLELYRNVLDNRIVSRFDAALEREDLATMAACARIMAAAGGTGNCYGTSLLVSRYISTRPLFSDPRRVAQGLLGGEGQPSPRPENSSAAEAAAARDGGWVSEGGEAGGERAAGAAMRSLSDLYRTLASSLRDEAVVMEQVFPSPGTAVATLVQRVFEQPIQAALATALRPPPATASQEALRSYLRLLAEAYRKTRALAEEAADLAGPGGALSPAELTDAACGPALGRYFVLEQRWLAGLGGSKLSAAGKTLSRDLILDLAAANEEAVKRCAVLVAPPHLSASVREVFHAPVSGQGRAAAAAPSCLLGQSARHVLLGLGAAADACVKQLAGAFWCGVDASFGEAAQADAAASFGAMFKATGEAAAIALVLKRYYDRVIAPHLGAAPTEAAACAQGLAELVAAVEERAGAGLQRAVVQLSRRLDLTLAAEQRKAEFRPLATAPAPALDRPTYACVLVSALLEGVGEQAREHLHGGNLASFLGELGRRAAAALQTHMLRFTFSAEGGLQWKRDVAEYAACMARLHPPPSALQAFEELKAVTSVLIVGPESVAGVVERTLRLSPQQALQYVQRREDFKTAWVGDRPLAALFAQG